MTVGSEAVDHLLAPDANGLPGAAVVGSSRLNVAVESAQPDACGLDRGLGNAARRRAHLCDRPDLAMNGVSGSAADVGDRDETVPQVMDLVVQIRRRTDRLEVVDTTGIELVHQFGRCIGTPLDEECARMGERSVCILLVPLAAVVTASVAGLDTDHVVTIDPVLHPGRCRAILSRWRPSCPTSVTA